MTLIEHLRQLAILLPIAALISLALTTAADAREPQERVETHQNITWTCDDGASGEARRAPGSITFKADGSVVYDDFFTFTERRRADRYVGSLWNPVGPASAVTLEGALTVRVSRTKVRGEFRYVGTGESNVCVYTAKFRGHRATYLDWVDKVESAVREAAQN